MAFEDSLTLDDPVFAGDDQAVEYEIFRRGEDRDNPQAVMEDVAGWALAWSLRKAVKRVDPYRSQGALAVAKSTSGGGILVVGTYNPNRAVNTQRVRVPLADSDTDALVGGLYVHALKRMDDGSERVLGYGTWPVFAPVVVG